LKKVIDAQRLGDRLRRFLAILEVEGRHATGDPGTAGREVRATSACRRGAVGRLFMGVVAGLIGPIGPAGRYDRFRKDRAIHTLSRTQPASMR